MTNRKHKGAVAAGHALTARAGMEALKTGGNAVDAAIAAALMACVVELVLAGPAGGGFAMVRMAGEDAPRLCDFFAQTPRRRDARAEMVEVFADFGDARQAFHIGPGSVAVPGFVDGLLALHERHGRLPLPELFAPAAEVAERGHPLSRFQAGLWRIIAPIMTHTREARATFAPGGRLLRAGETLRLPALARLFRRLGQGGMEAWRNEAWPALLAHTAMKGHLREADLAGYEVEWRKPLRMNLDAWDAEAWLNPPPAASGVLVGRALAWLLEKGEDIDCAPCRWARALAAMEEARALAGHDPLWMLEHLPPAWRGTTHVSVVDGEGNAVAMTVSNGEGNGHFLPDAGFMPNNMLGEADVNPAGLGNWPEDARLSSMMAPTLARRGDGAWLALGSGGSSRIRSVLVLMLARLLGQGEMLQEAVAAPRLHLEDGLLDMEPGFDETSLARLRALFPTHRLWSAPSMYFGGCHVALRDAAGNFAAVGDARREGAARFSGE